MKREVIATADGSKTLYISALNENYHSSHGAVAEAQHVFIENGLKLLNNFEIHILELGFGTGLNVLATIDDFLKTDKNHIIHYHTVEKYPLSPEETVQLGYENQFRNLKETVKKIHSTAWEKPAEIVPDFFLTKFQCDFLELENISLPIIDLVYFDCFGARVQPDLWEKPLLQMVADKMRPGALLTTYSSKGSFRRILKELHFEVEKKAGPAGKREMVNAVKI